jgi:hypothetical protein
MKITSLTPTQSLNPAYRKEKVPREAIDRLKRELPLLLRRTTGKVSESTLRDHLQTFLRGVAYPDTDFLVQTELRRMDTVIHDGPKRKDPVGVIIEAKTTENRGEMFSTDKPNVKALHELVLYFLRERHRGNTGIKQLLITDGDAVFLFADAEFERLFWNKKRFRKELLALDADTGKNNPLLYERIARHVAELPAEEELRLTVLHLSLFVPYCEDGDPETDERLLPLYKILSPVHLLRRPFAGDSNHLDRGFYRELLHLIGLEERPENPKKKSGNKIIDRLPAGRRHEASMLENTLQVARKEQRFRKVSGLNGYGSTAEEREFAVALELCLTWVNRILFLKLLETQLVAYHGGASEYRFLTPNRIPDYDALNTLFFDVLNRPVGEREDFVADFARVPYLNSSLFEISELEDAMIRVNSLKDQHELPLADRSVLSSKERGPLPPLEYLFRFLDAYDFGGEGRARIQEDNKRLINASVLGLIFEKINGYRDGSFYTPGFITEYMCRETIRRAVVQKFRDDTGRFADFDAEDFADLRNYLRRDNYKTDVRVAANALVDSVTVCDPAVGSGHFLVSALNEMIATKSDLGILGADAGAVDTGIDAVVVNDELLISYRRNGEPYEYRVETDGHGRPHVPPEVQRVQETLFAEKRRIIEGCLFGVDLNPNSVKICRLRLWIELLKSAYYVLTPPPLSGGEGGPPTDQLETLPNIDINIKRGNSLISRFALDDDLSGALGDSDLTLADYRRAVSEYHRARGSESKAELLDVIERIKRNFETYISTNDPRVKKLAKARGRLDQLRSLLEVGDLFGSVDEKKVCQEMKPLEKSIAKLEAELEGVRDNAIYRDAFEWRFEFPAVLGEDGAYVGFDVVVGNPPYVRIQEIRKDEVIFYNKEYETATFNYDLYVLFYELGVTIMGERGYLGYITPSKFSHTRYGKGLRRLIRSSNILYKYIDFKALQVFEEATTYTAVAFFSHNASSYDYSTPKELDRSQINVVNKVVTLSDSVDQFYHLNEIETSIYKKFTGPGVEASYFVGVQTSFDKLFIQEEEKSTCQQSDYYRPLLKGAEISRYQKPKSKFNIIFPYKIKDDTAELATLEELGHDNPCVREFLASNKNRFVSKVGEISEWYRYGRSQNITKFQQPKIMVQVLAKGPSFTYDYTGEYVFVGGGTAGGYGVRLEGGSESEHLKALAVFNSKLTQWLVQSTSSVFRGGYYAYGKETLQRIRLTFDNSDILADLASQILAQKAYSPAADTSALEAEIDLLVYRLYGLTYAEVLVVDPEFGLSEAEYASVNV